MLLASGHSTGRVEVVEDDVVVDVEVDEVELSDV
jgi:hypothetical protein